MKELEMKKILKKMMFAGLGSLIILGCSAEDKEENLNSLNALGSTNTNQVADYSDVDLLGRWELVSMTSVDVPVDLNEDNVRQTNILDETSCFENMYFNFNSDNSVETNQARLFFNETGNFTCSEKVYAARYELSGNNLAVTFQVKGNSYTENRVIVIERDGGKEYLKISLTGAETDAAVYINDGRENTVAAELKQIDFVYIKK